MRSKSLREKKQRSDRLLTTIEKMQLQDVGYGPQGQDKLTRPPQNVLFNKDVDRQVARFNKYLTRCQSITNKVSR
jgi:hypothetical protein